MQYRSQIKPVLTMDSNILNMLREHFGVTEKYLSNSASTQTLTDCCHYPCKKEFYIVGDKKLYLNCGGDVITEIYEVISKYKKQYPELIDDDVNSVMEYNNDITRIEGVIADVKRGKRAKYAEVTGYDNKTYTIDENIFFQTINAENIISKGNHISFVIKSQGPKRTYIKDIMLIAP